MITNVKKSRVAFCPCDDSNLPLFHQLQNSLRQFHTEEELPLIRYPLTEVNDPDKWYRATPLIAKDLIKEYDTVIKLDADQIIVGPLNEIWEIEADVGVVLNDPSYPIGVWDIAPYINNGLVVLKNEQFINHWWRLCISGHFQNYQYREQDLLNIICSDYSLYKIVCLDDTKIYGEFAKPFWSSGKLEGDRIVVDVNGNQRELAVIHFGGGNTPDKGNYKIRFQPEVVKRIEELIK